MSEIMLRLHITPLNPELLDAILGPSLSTYTASVSYHSVQTDPENSFGYVELPAMDAAKIKKKLNGAILKGKKLKIEDARPPKRTFSDTEDDEASQAQPSAIRSSKRSKSDGNVIAARELSPDRKVKRGWTESKSDKSGNKKKRETTEKRTKSQTPSKYSNNAELLFRTKIPAKRSSEARKEKHGKSRKEANAGVVHEFKKTTAIPSFLRNDASKEPNQAVEYKDGIGWVNEGGEVVEKETSKASKKRQAAKLGLEIDTTKAQALHSQRPKQIPPSPPPSQSNSLLDSSTQHAGGQVDDETSSSGTSSSSTTSSDTEGEEETQSTTSDHLKQEPDRSASAAPQGTVHPLEALFKKPKLPVAATTTTTIVANKKTSNSLSDTASPGSGKAKPNLELSTTFSFFGPSDDEDEDGETERVTHHTPHTNDIAHLLPQMPMTPFSSQDFRVRRIRSAAPTPDTADIRKSTGYGSLILGEDDPDDVLSDGEEHDHGLATNADTVRGTEEPQSLQGLPQSEFEKRFWDKRGENNRAWKARRRAVLKEQRQRENRARRPQGH